MHEDDPVAAFVDQWRRERPDLDPDPMLIVARIVRLAEIFDAYLRPTFADAGLGNGEFDVLAALRREGQPYALSPGELSEAMLVTTGAVSKRIDRLQHRGLVDRSIAATDARARLVTLTPAGVELVDALMGRHLDRQRALVADLTAQERERLGDLLGVLGRSVD